MPQTGLEDAKPRGQEAARGIGRCLGGCRQSAGKEQEKPRRKFKLRQLIGAWPRAIFRCAGRSSSNGSDMRSFLSAQCWPESDMWGMRKLAHHLLSIAADLQ